MQYENPIIPGFYPDPSICRVGSDYYLVNSSFEYFPGVPIFQSKDLVNWQQIGNCLTRESQLSLHTTRCSDGIYAPTIRYHNGTFYLATTNSLPGKGFSNFYVTATDPAGEWSDPIYVDQGGLDPSLCFATNGKVYWTGNGSLWAKTRGIYQSQIDPATGKLISNIRFIWSGTGGSYPEAPHLFQRGEYYYLSVAEGGTAETHMVTIARAKDPFGPFESCPHNPVLSHRSIMSPIQATGHADFFEDHLGRWWVVFLGIRYADQGFHILGRETYMAPVDWTSSGWPVINGGQRITYSMELSRASLPVSLGQVEAVREDFDSPTLAPQWVFLRNPNPANWSLTDRPGWLRLTCALPTLDDLANPSFLGRRQQHFIMKMEANMEFQPEAETDEAGITVLIDNLHHAEVLVTWADGKRVALLRRRIGSLSQESPAVLLPDSGPVLLSVECDSKQYAFHVGTAGAAPHLLGHHEARYVSTEVAGGYTGVMLALYATSNQVESTAKAWFDWVDYRQPVVL